MKMSKSESGKIGALKSIEITKKKLHDRIISYDLNPTLCLECRIPIEYSKRNNTFCGSSHSASYTNKLKGNTSVSCLHCGQLITGKNHNIRKYCNKSCQTLYEYSLRIKSWLTDGIEIDKRTIKQYLSKTFGNECSVCDISEWNKKPIVFDLEHKDGNSENNHPDNLCLICPNCHSQTDTFKGRNRSNGRHARMTRYREGKSF